MKLLGFGRSSKKTEASAADESFDTEIAPVVFSQTELEALNPVLGNLNETVEIYEDDDDEDHHQQTSQQEEERSHSTVNTVGSKYWMNYLEEKENGDMTSPLSQTSPCRFGTDSRRSSFDTVSNKPPGLPLSPRSQALLPKNDNTTSLVGLKIQSSESRDEQSPANAGQAQQRDFSIEIPQDIEKKMKSQPQPTVAREMAAPSDEELSQSLSARSSKSSSELSSFSFNTAMLRRQKSTSPPSKSSVDNAKEEEDSTTSSLKDLNLMKRVTNLLRNTKHMTDPSSEEASAKDQSEGNKELEKQVEDSANQTAEEASAKGGETQQVEVTEPPAEKTLARSNEETSAQQLSDESQQNGGSEEAVDTCSDTEPINSKAQSEEGDEIESKPEALLEHSVSPALSVKDLQRLGDMSSEESLYVEADSNANYLAEAYSKKEEEAPRQKPDPFGSKQQVDSSNEEETQSHSSASRRDLYHIADSSQDDSVYFESDSKSESQGDVPTEQEIRLLESKNAGSQSVDIEEDEDDLLGSVIHSVEQKQIAVPERPPQKAGPKQEQTLHVSKEIDSKVEKQQDRQQATAEIDTRNLISDDPYEWAYDVWERRGLMQKRKRAPRVYTRVEDIEQKVVKKAAASDKGDQQTNESSQDVIITPRESFVQLDLTGVQDDSPAVGHGRLSAPVASSKSVRTAKDRKSFANILEQWRACSDDKPNSHFLSPEQSFISYASNTSMERSDIKNQSFGMVPETSKLSSNTNRPWQQNIKKATEPSGAELEDHKIPATRMPVPAYAQVGGVAKASSNSEETVMPVVSREEPAEKPAIQTAAVKAAVSHEVPVETAIAYGDQARFQRIVNRFEPMKQMQVASSSPSKEYPSQAAKLKESMKMYGAQPKAWRESIENARKLPLESHRAQSVPRMGGANVHERARSPQAHFQRQKSPPKSRGDYKSAVQAVLSDVKQEDPASRSSWGRSKSVGRPRPITVGSVRGIEDADDSSMGPGPGSYAPRGVSNYQMAMTVRDLQKSDSSNKKKSPDNERRWSLTNRIRTSIEKLQCRPPSPEELYQYNMPVQASYAGYVATHLTRGVGGDADLSEGPPRIQGSNQLDSQDSTRTKKVVRDLREAHEDEDRFTPREENFSERPWRRDMVVERVKSFGTQTSCSVSEDICQCSSSVFSGNDELIEFFLPLMGMACTCGKRPRGLNNPEDPIALENILRPWQVDFLANFGIYRGDQLVKAHHRSASALSSALRQYRRKKGMTPFRSKSCKMALEIWSKTCKAFVRSIRKQVADGTLDLRLPNTLYILSSFLEKMPSRESSPRSSQEPSPRDEEFGSQEADHGSREPSPREEEEFRSHRAEL